jgi:hypothetical protein
MSFIWLNCCNYNFFYHRFGLINALIVYIYTVTFQQVDEDEYGGIWDIIKGNKISF